MLPGLTIVVSPLISLMQDQMKKLPLELPGACFSGGLSAYQVSDNRLSWIADNTDGSDDDSVGGDDGDCSEDDSEGGCNTDGLGIVIKAYLKVCAWTNPDFYLILPPTSHIDPSGITIMCYCTSRPYQGFVRVTRTTLHTVI